MMNNFMLYLGNDRRSIVCQTNHRLTGDCKLEFSPRAAGCLIELADNLSSRIPGAKNLMLRFHFPFHPFFKMFMILVK